MIRCVWSFRHRSPGKDCVFHSSSLKMVLVSPNASYLRPGSGTSGYSSPASCSPRPAPSSVRALSGRLSALSVFHSFIGFPQFPQFHRFWMALLYGRAERLTAQNGDFWPGQWSTTAVWATRKLRLCYRCCSPTFIRSGARSQHHIVCALCDRAILRRASVGSRRTSRL